MLNLSHKFRRPILRHANQSILNRHYRNITTHHSPHPFNLEDIKRSPVPISYCNEYSVEPWPKTHSFRMPKFKLLYEHLKENKFNMENLQKPEMPTDDEISIAHSIEYINNITNGDKQAYRSCNLPYSQPLADRAKLSLNGTLNACKKALKYGIGAQISGGYHHAHKNNGSGFCIFNDLAYSALHLLSSSQTYGIRNICILDFDVHQGDGTASICQDYDNIYTVSVHCEANFPWPKQKSDIDIGLETDLNDKQYLDELQKLMEFLIKDKHKNGYPIDLIIYEPGVDVHKDDKLGRLNITDDGLIARDKMVFDTCLNNDIPIACVVGGGYDKNDYILAERHGFLHWNALEMWNKHNLG